jgi:hypothetical protein
VIQNLKPPSQKSHPQYHLTISKTVLCPQITGSPKKIEIEIETKINIKIKNQKNKKPNSFELKPYLLHKVMNLLKLNTVYPRTTPSSLKS